MAEKTKDSKTAAAKLAKKAEGKVNLVLICDESGSMMGNQEAVVNGVNEFIAGFRDKKDVTITLSFFDSHPGEDRVRVKFAGKAAKKVKDLSIADYNPRGMTPLNDAIMESIAALDKSLEEDERAFVVVLTDGAENASESTQAQVEKVIKKREKKGWSFLILGANVDAGRVAAGYGLKAPGTFLNFTASRSGTSNAMKGAHSHAMLFASAGSKAQYDAASAEVSSLTAGYVPEHGEAHTRAADAVLRKMQAEADEEE